MEDTFFGCRRPNDKQDSHSRKQTATKLQKFPKFTRRANFTRGKKKRRKKEKEGKGSEMIKASLLGESTCHYR